MGVIIIVSIVETCHVSGPDPIWFDVNTREVDFISIL